jgi:beta-glucosidase
MYPAITNDHYLTFSSKADVSSVMCAYNRFNKVSSCHNAQLLGPNGLLRSDGFQGKDFAGVAQQNAYIGNKGYVVSDWGATHDSASGNANAGLDMEQPGDYILIGMYTSIYIVHSIC